MKIHPLKIYILQNGIKQKELAKLSGISEITIHRIVNYKTTKSFKKTIQKLNNVTGIPVIDLLYPEESCNKK
jgi:transcriptional regulator with XRE-family HTH domain